MVWLVFLQVIIVAHCCLASDLLGTALCMKLQSYTDDSLRAGPITLVIFLSQHPHCMYS